MGLASKGTLVDATSGRLDVVTMGVREQVVKPATKFTGSFAMRCSTDFNIASPTARSPQLPKQWIATVILAGGLVLLPCLPVGAGTVSSQLHVTARVIQSCRVTTDALMSQLGNGGGTTDINCQNNAPSAGSASGGALPSGTAGVTYSVETAPGSGGQVKIVTVNF
jgi:hypothetical protein